jgi:hypothetical protein
MQSVERKDPTWSPFSLNVALTGEIGRSCMYPVCFERVRPSDEVQRTTKTYITRSQRIAIVYANRRGGGRRGYGRR